MKQQNLKLSNENTPKKGTIAHYITKKHIYGGSLDYRKLKRPVSTQKALHITFSMGDITYKKTGGFRKEVVFVNKKLLLFCEKFNIRIYKHAINSNHIHLVCRVNDKNDLSRFLRAFSGAIALYFKLKYKLTTFWKGRPFTRIVSWGRDFKNVCAYVVKNFKEVVGFVKYSPRNTKAYSFIEQWASTG